MSTIENWQSLPILGEEETVHEEEKKLEINVVRPSNHPSNFWLFRVVSAWVNHPEILDTCVLLLKKVHVTRDELMDVLKIMHGLSRSTAQRRVQLMESLDIIKEVNKDYNAKQDQEIGRPSRTQKRYRFNPRLKKKFKHFLRFIDRASTELTETKEITTYQGFNLMYQEIRPQ